MSCVCVALGSVSDLDVVVQESRPLRRRRTGGRDSRV